MHWGPAILSVLTAGSLTGATLVRVEWVDPQHADRRATGPIDRDFLQSPGPTTLHLASLGHPQLWAELFWLAIVQELGRIEDAQSSAKWDRVERWAHIAVDLDPKYLTVYHTVAIHLTAYAKRDFASDTLLEKGRIHLPDRFELPFLLGYNAYFLRNEFDRASDLFLEASNLPNAPRFLAPLAGRARFQGGDEAGAIELLEILLNNTEGPQQRDVADRLKVLRSELRFRLFDEACTRYREQTGRKPESADLLRRMGYVNAPPEDFWGEVIELDENCRARSAKVPLREDEASRFGMEK